MINMEQEIIMRDEKPLQTQGQDKDALVLAMEEEGINVKYIAKLMKNVMDNAVIESKKWNIMEDFVTKLSAARTWHKMQKDTPDVQIQIANIFQTWENIL